MKKYDVPAYQVYKADGMDRGYVSNLLKRKRSSPTIRTVLRIDRVLASRGATPEEADELLMAAGFSPMFGPRYRDDPPEDDVQDEPVP